MGKIGNLGKLIIFEVSAEKVLTFDKLNQAVKGRWAVQEPIQGKPFSEFLGPGQRTISFTVHLSAVHGVKPRETMERIESAVENGEPYPLIIGNRKVGDYQWVVTDMSETWGEVLQGGNLISVNLTLSLREYR
ncbi:MAG: phage tail protein [bacterium]|nr:phage tail protein [bacterium]